MNYLNYLRNKSFWLIDALKGRLIKNHLKEVSLILKNPTSEQSKNIRKKHIENLLLHACKTTLYYSSFINNKDIVEFPVIKKTDIQQNFEAFKSSKFKEKTNYKVATSGSTGVPFFLFQDTNKRQRNTADVLYFSKECNFTLGNRLYELEVWRKHNKKSRFKSWIQNIKQFDISKLSDTRIEEFLQLLKTSKQKKTILGFASSYEQICQYLDKSKNKIEDYKISSIIANSEYLNLNTKKSMSNYFNAPVLSRYSSEEIGIIAQQTIKSPDYFIINHASYHVELLSLEEDTPVKVGEIGRIVVTDLFNYAMPIIRYDTGDIAKLIEDDGITKFEHIEGRKMDLIYDTKGNIISSFVVYTKFYNYYKHLNQYQFIQEGDKKYHIKLNIHDENFPFEKELIEDIKKDFGFDSIIKVTYVKEIPTLSSGKRKKVLNTFHKN
ncbi:CoF synthetase [Flaviramulus sp. BrNp1-15]|uniref:CoF synthetase n=1 Tax=Flaviramulus sp. BrNp1-15 TaxID=2916754 RepID=UPI001EE8A559|nr:CoF synthetase [Flaviramulus sp. BrNp1-15]ULC58322.1 CoF synthetase [Flaviramulus sp. BrNp1-15]